MNIPSDLKVHHQRRMASHGRQYGHGRCDRSRPGTAIRHRLCRNRRKCWGRVHKGDTCATVESVKAAADVYMPVSGKVVAVNEDLPSTPEVVNSDPYGAAWMVKIEPTDLKELDSLLDAKAYEAHAQEQGH